MKLEDGAYASPRWSWEILDCAMPLSLDTYSNCAFQCVYCFSFFQRAVGASADDYLHHRVRAVNVERIKRMFSNPDEHAGQFADYIKRRLVLQWGGLSDGFDWYERRFGKSLELLRFFREIDYPISISTKGTWFLDDPRYVEAFRDARNVHVKYSIITADSAAARRLEAGVASPAERLRALERLKALGVGATTLRLRPFVIGLTEKTVDELFAAAGAAGCWSVSTEFLCLEKRATPNHLARYRAISEVVGADMWEFYRRHSYSGAGLMRLNYELKRPYVARMRELADRHGLRLYVSDAHHKETSAGAGCCGLPDEGPLSNYNRGQFAEAMQIAKRRGSVRWSDIAGDAAWLKEIRWVGATGYNTGGTAERARRMYHTMYDFMRDAWNTPTSWSSPARYFGGVLVPGGTDDSGDIVYLYNRPLVEGGGNVENVAALMAAVGSYNERRSVDGGEGGHVAFPIYVLVGDESASVCAALDTARLNYVIVVPNASAMLALGARYDAEVIMSEQPGQTLRDAALAHARSEGVASQIWLLDGAARFPAGGARATLSGYEGLAVASVRATGLELAPVAVAPAQAPAQAPGAMDGHQAPAPKTLARATSASAARLGVDVALAYLAKPKYGGWPAYTVHLAEGLRRAGARVGIYKIGREERRSRPFLGAETYRNVSASTVLSAQRVLVVALDKGALESSEAMEVVQGAAAVVIHDPAEVKSDALRRAYASARRIVAIRSAPVPRIRAAVPDVPVTFVPHPFAASAAMPGVARTTHAVSLARIDWDKHTDVIVSANAQLPGELQCRLHGAENRLYSHHKLDAIDPEWRRALVSGDAGRDGAAVAAGARFMVDLSTIAGDGGGTQYSFFEAWAGGAHLVVHRGWLVDGGEVVDGTNCTAVADASELVAVLRGGPDAVIADGGRAVLDAHDARAMAEQMLVALG